MKAIHLFCSVILFLFLSFCISCKQEISEITLIPYPNQVTQARGNYELKETVTYFSQEKTSNEKDMLVHFLEDELRQKTAGQSLQKADIRLILTTASDSKEEDYNLLVNSKGIQIEASGNAGLFYGIQTLRQLAKTDLSGKIRIPYVSIQDSPRFKWRAMLLDEARTFHGIKVVKQLIEEMAALKMNRLQWHLTDDQGWRIDIQKYPQLTQINSPLTLSEDLLESTDEKSKKGYYTKDEIWDIVDYAAKRHITIIPEIELPGHASAAITAYPWLGVSKKSISLPVKSRPVKVTQIFPDIFDVSDTRTMKFFCDVMDEVALLFPGNIIHIGGDEVNYLQWKESPAVNAFMKQKGIDTPAGLQRWATNQMSHYLSRKGIRMMGWNDIMGIDLHGYKDNSDLDFQINENLADGTIIHFWKGDTQLIEDAVRKGYDVVNAHHIYTYMDYSYESIPLDKAYEFEPVPEGLDEMLHSKIIGLGCQMWGGASCTIETVEKLHKQIFPRIAAYAETGWTLPERKDRIRFRESLNQLTVGWNNRGITVFDENK